MDWTQFAIMIGSFSGLFFWSRAESRNDQRQMLSIIIEIKEEIKDFHGRLCAIEERRK